MGLRLKPGAHEAPEPYLRPPSMDSFAAMQLLLAAKAPNNQTDAVGLSALRPEQLTADMEQPSGVWVQQEQTRCPRQLAAGAMVAR